MQLHFSWARSAVGAQGMVLDLIHRYKYQRALWLEPFLAQLLVTQAAPGLRKGRWNMIVPIPLHSLKQREREFNQAEHLARHLGTATGLPVNTRILKRSRPTETQTQLSRKERAANVRHAFALHEPPVPIKGKRIILVDDVFTTGSTSSACARLLRQAGARDVCVWTVARGLFN